MRRDIPAIPDADLTAEDRIIILEQQMGVLMDYLLALHGSIMLSRASVDAVIDSVAEARRRYRQPRPRRSAEEMK